MRLVWIIALVAPLVQALALVPRGPLQRPRPHCQPLARTPTLCATIADGGSGNGGSNVNGGGRGKGEGDDGDEEEEDIDVSSALSDAGLSADQLPEDMTEALKSGRIGPDELSNYKGALSSPVTRALAASAYIRCRLIAEPRLANVLAIEIGVGCLSTLAAEKAARGDNFRKELDFVLANQVRAGLPHFPAQDSLAGEMGRGSRPAGAGVKALA